MAVTFTQLLLAAPFPEDRRKTLMENIDRLTEDQKYQLTNLAWRVLAQMYFARLKAERDLIMDEVILNKRKFNQNDFEEIQAKLLHEFARKLEAAESRESIDEVKKELEKYKASPFPQDQTPTQ
ncbi:hypothetical protein FJY90_05110 [Candidatus Gottesmanbacteria bacterium]|nr:hypothetical protein [Candidatus Gottesmanbacteria bacterium]